MIDVQAYYRTVVAKLHEKGYAPRDADGSDFARPGARFRFKVGTSRGEVTITVWKHEKQVDVVRAISPSSLDVALGYIETASRAV